MDISLIVVFWVIVTIIQAIAERKKAPPPPDSTDLEFEIPPIQKPPQVQEINLAEVYRQKKITAAAQSKTETKFAEPEVQTEQLEITADSALNAIILNEILDKPKSLRRKKF